MKSYEEIKALLRAEIERAETAGEREIAMERYERFALHGMIPNDLAHDE